MFWCLFNIDNSGSAIVNTHLLKNSAGMKDF